MKTTLKQHLSSQKGGWCTFGSFWEKMKKNLLEKSRTKIYHRRMVSKDWKWERKYQIELTDEEISAMSKNKFKTVIDK